MLRAFSWRCSGITCSVRAQTGAGCIKIKCLNPCTVSLSLTADFDKSSDLGKKAPWDIEEVNGSGGGKDLRGLVLKPRVQQANS